KVLLSAWIGGIEHVELVLTAAHLPGVDGLTLSIMNEPVRMLLGHRRTLRNIERRGPNPRRKTHCGGLLFHWRHPVGEQVGIRRGVLAAGVLVALIDMEEVVAELLQVLRLPGRIGERRALVQAKVV